MRILERLLLIGLTALIFLKFALLMAGSLLERTNPLDESSPSPGEKVVPTTVCREEARC